MGEHRHLASSARPPRVRRPFTRPAASGFTLLEAQVAIFIFVFAMVGLIGHGRVCSQLISSVEQDDRLEGVATPDSRRVVATVTQAGSGAGAPRCEVRLESIEEAAGSMDVEVVVTRRSP